jgi:hypothetical protein
MPIPYRDAEELEELGSAAYLKIISVDSGYIGALFLINARGEPLEFTYNRIETPHTFLWRQRDLRRHAARKLTASLLLICPKTPRLILCLAEEVGSELFCRDIHVSIPVCRIAPAMNVTPYIEVETKDNIEASGSMNLFWFPVRPQDDSIELKLLHELNKNGLLLEPFERASLGLREVYAEIVGEEK